MVALLPSYRLSQWDHHMVCLCTQYCDRDGCTPTLIKIVTMRPPHGLSVHTVLWQRWLHSYPHIDCHHETTTWFVCAHSIVTEMAALLPLYRLSPWDHHLVCLCTQYCDKDGCTPTTHIDCHHETTTWFVCAHSVVTEMVALLPSYRLSPWDHHMVCLCTQYCDRDGCTPILI